MTSTPPPRSAAHTPSTPLHGARYESRQPYVVRKSTRASTLRAARTPSPGPLNSSTLTPRSPASKRPSAFRSAAHTFSPPSSPQSSPQQKSRKRAQKSSEAHKFGALGFENSPKDHPRQASDEALLSTTNMLPTPAKTPRKKVVPPGAISAARVIFPNRPDTIEDAMPTPRRNGRKAKRHIGFSLGSFGDEDDGSQDEKIEIYTDTKDKLPEVDLSEDNPFYARPGKPAAPVRRSSKRRKVGGSNDHNEEVQELLKRNEGMVYVFRGKKVYRKFEVEEEADDDEDDVMMGAEPRTSTSHHFTRSSIKPRLLFPVTRREAHNGAGDDSDEEAITDIEDPESHGMAVVETSSTLKVTTPVKPIFAPATPPGTGHATRMTKKRAMSNSPPAKPEPVAALPPRLVTKRGRNSSPFDGWKRMKASTDATMRGTKRNAESLEGPAEGHKKLRGSRA